MPIRPCWIRERTELYQKRIKNNENWYFHYNAGLGRIDGMGILTLTGLACLIYSPQGVDTAHFPRSHIWYLKIQLKCRLVLHSQRGGGILTPSLASGDATLLLLFHNSQSDCMMKSSSFCRLLVCLNVVDDWFQTERSRQSWIIYVDIVVFCLCCLLFDVTCQFAWMVQFYVWTNCCCVF